MAHGLSLLVQVKGLGEAADAVSAVMAPLDPKDTAAAPTSSHGAARPFRSPIQNDPPGTTSLLLATVYDARDLRTPTFATSSSPIRPRSTRRRQ